MLKEGKFGLSEAVWLAVNAIATKVFYTSPGFLIRFVGTSGWYMTIVSALTAMLGFGFVILLLKRFPNKGLTEIFELSMGRVAGFLASMTFSFLFLLESSVLVREFSDVLRSYTFPEMPIELLTGAMVVTLGIVIYFGLESLARLVKLSAYFILAGFLLVLILSAENFHPANMFPILGYGLDKTVLHGLARSSYYGPVVLLAFIAPSLHNLKTVKKAGFIALAICGAIVAGALLCTLLVFPFETGQEQTDPMYALARNIKYGYFFTRIDILFIFIWIVASVMCTSASFYISVSIFCKSFRLTDQRPVIIPMLIVFYTLALAPQSLSKIIYESVQGAREHYWAIYFGLPVIALIIALLRNKRGDGTDA